MTTGPSHVLIKSGARSGLSELDIVELLKPTRTDDGDVLPSGTRGTVVGSFRDGAAYIVEFPEPLGALATVPNGDLSKVAS